MQQRTDWVDYAKGIGIILVVYGHVARGLYTAGLEVWAPLHQLIDSIIYSFHMPLFFFLAGLFFYQSFSRRGDKNLVLNKLDTVLYPYIVWSILQGCIEAFFSDYTNGSVSYSEVFSLFWSPRAQFWFLYALFIIFVLAAVIYSVVPKRFSILVFIIALLLYLTPTALREFYVYSYIAKNFVFFMLGVVFHLHFNVKKMSTPLCLLGLFSGFLLGQWLFHGFLGLDYKAKGPGLFLVAVVSILFVVSLSAYLAKKSFGFIAFLGSCSMAIYLMHTLVLAAFRIGLSEFFGLESYSTHLVLGIVGSVAASVVVVIVINRVKIPFVFSAPISFWLITRYRQAAQLAYR